MKRTGNEESQNSDRIELEIADMGYLFLRSWYLQIPHLEEVRELLRIICDDDRVWDICCSNNNFEATLKERIFALLERRIHELRHANLAGDPSQKVSSVVILERTKNLLTNCAEISKMRNLVIENSHKEWNGNLSSLAKRTREIVGQELIDLFPLDLLTQKIENVISLMETEEAIRILVDIIFLMQDKSKLCLQSGKLSIINMLNTISGDPSLYEILLQKKLSEIIGKIEWKKNPVLLGEIAIRSMWNPNSVFLENLSLVQMK